MGRLRARRAARRAPLLRRTFCNTLTSMSVENHYKALADRLIAAYTKQLIAAAPVSPPASLRALPPRDRQFLSHIAQHATVMYRYQVPQDLDRALEVLDLELIYAGAEKREREHEAVASVETRAYEDHVVLELLDVFKNSFFTWVNKPACPMCAREDDVEPTGVSGPPAGANVDETGRVEHYRCNKCRTAIEFARINNPVSLLRTRRGRCGEWVNCFLLCLQALLGADAQIRYVWNYEDHVWCEYYSVGLRRWVHLDPCEAAFDEPHLYCQNWGKRMSWCIGFGLGYVVDLSDKYITADKQIDRSAMVRPQSVAAFIAFTNGQLLRKYYDTTDGPEQARLLKVYSDVVLLKNQEATAPTPTGTKEGVPQGRQSGSAEWTRSRGEGG